VPDQLGFEREWDDRYYGTMKITYDKEADALYIRLLEGARRRAEDLLPCMVAA
jgi:hypothetical protein